MRLHTHTPLRSFAIGLISLASISTNISFSASANAQSFPNDSVPVTPTNSGATQYLVYLPNVANIKQAKILAPDAFVSRLDTGEQVVQLGRFNNLNLAQRRAAQFSQAGLAPQIRIVQSKFATNPANTIPSIPTSNPVPNSSAPIPVDSIPRNDSLPGVPNSGFPNTSNPNNSQPNSIEIVRSPQPQPIPQQNQPIPIQTASQPIPANSQPTNDVSQLHYFVIVPTGSVSELQRVQTVVPTAQLRSSYRGTYIEVQGFPDRPSAETLNLTMRRQNFDSRVVYF
ncbi:hypothetical protein [Pseudanabaena yagii]|uniref:SPOR domain-containing protein n=1 Tax=Pseudanabaena yagii GIHE-NHR1 TaxID=2722753 RepID=A0ABX1LWY1_9CYAN|nr:hypothetical protein [Pseudanabaena yagii]NMF60710.1 hypothetical protein [Pseudanabaena yagii GIHE-NHR1]